MRFAPLTPEQAAFYTEHSQIGYVEDLVRAEALDEDRARRKAAVEYSTHDDDGVTYVAGYADIGGAEEWVGVIGWVLKGFGVDHEEPTLYIYDLEVFERFRRRGFGEQLLLHATAEAARAGAGAVRLTVWEGNDGAKALYRRLGFRDENARMRLRLPAD